MVCQIRAKHISECPNLIYIMINIKIIFHNLQIFTRNISEMLRKITQRHFLFEKIPDAQWLVPNSNQLCSLLNYKIQYVF